MLDASELIQVQDNLFLVVEDERDQTGPWLSR